MSVRSPTVLVVAAALSIAAIAPAHACSTKKYWFPWEEAKDRNEWAERVAQDTDEGIIFLGKVKAITTIAVSRLDSDKHDVDLVDFKVTGVLKGYTFDNVTVRKQGPLSGKCGWDTPGVDQEAFVLANLIRGSSDLDSTLMVTGAEKQALLKAFAKRGLKPKAP